MKVLILGSAAVGNIGAFFLQAARDLGHDCVFVEIDYLNDRPTLARRVLVRALGRRPPQFWKINRDVRQVAREYQPDVVLAVKGMWLTPDTIEDVRRSTGAFLVNFATDDPFNPVVSRADLVASIPLFDMYACTKRAIMDDVRRAGSPNAVFLPFGYEPALHFVDTAIGAAAARFACDVVFIGGADRDRIPMMARLAAAEQGWRLHLYGGIWMRSELARLYKGFALGRDYRLAIGAARINLGLVRRANRDGHAMRTFEIPACGGFMLAERTDELLEWFDEDRHVACFGSDDELVDKIAYYLKHDEVRRRIAAAGHQLVTSGGHTYQDRLAQILRAR